MKYNIIMPCHHLNSKIEEVSEINMDKNNSGIKIVKFMN